MKEFDYDNYIFGSFIISLLILITVGVICGINIINEGDKQINKVRYEIYAQDVASYEKQWLDVNLISPVKEQHTLKEIFTFK